MTLKETKPITIIGSAATVLLIIGLFTIIILQYRNNHKTPPKPSPKPYQATIPNIDISKLTPLPQQSNFQNELAKIKPYLPYPGYRYSIIYVEPIGALDVQIEATTSAEYIQVKKSAEQFIKSKRVNDICSLNIFWLSMIVPPKTLPAGSLITTDCLPSPNPKP